MITLCHAPVSPDPASPTITLWHALVSPDPASHTFIFVTGIPWSCFPHVHICHWYPLILLPTWSLFVMQWYPLILLSTWSYLSLISLILLITWSIFVTGIPWSCLSHDHSLSLVSPDPAYHTVTLCHWYPLTLLITRSLFVTDIPWSCFPHDHICHWYPWSCLSLGHSLSLVSPDPASHTITVCHALVSPDHASHTIIFVTDIPWSYIPLDHICHWFP
jgi:hypothetical protein